MVERGTTGPARSSPQPPRAVARRARLEGAGPVAHHRSRNEGAAGRCRSRSSRLGSWFSAPPDCALRTDCAFPRSKPRARFHHATRSAASPHIRWVDTTRTTIPPARGRGARKGRGHSVRRRLAAKALDGHRPPGPAKPVRCRSADLVCDLKPSGRRPPERRPGSHSATAQPAACGLRRRWRSGAPARAPFRRAWRTIG
jgi:hypothetical protein